MGIIQSVYEGTRRVRGYGNLVYPARWKAKTTELLVVSSGPKGVETTIAERLNDSVGRI